MTPRPLLRPARRFWPILQSSSSIPRRRWASSVGPSLTSGFYKTFTRPVAKCLLLAMFTYQLAYFAWVKLETDEIRDDRQAEVASLEEQVKALQSKATTGTKSS